MRNNTPHRHSRRARSVESFARNHVDFTTNRRPVACGTGLVALDIVMNEGLSLPLRLSAGGSCGNVMILLSYLGWKSHPLARLAPDFAADEIRADMAKWGVDTKFVRKRKSGSTPVILERILTREGSPPRHVYDWRCPDCSTWFPPFKPLLRSETQAILETVNKVDVFYFDRATPAAIQMASAYRERKSLIMFEPNSVRDMKLFRRAITVSHVLKYSHEQMGRLGDPVEESIPAPILHVETLDANGVRYRHNSGNWKWMQAPRVLDVRDTAGAGDWLSAGLLHMLGNEGMEKRRSWTMRQIEEALRFAQSLAAVCCMFDGPRGAMYALEREKLLGLVGEYYYDMVTRAEQEAGVSTNGLPRIDTPLLKICPECKRAASRNSQ